MNSRFVFASVAVILPILTGCTTQDNGTLETVRVGYFPNITHAQPLVGLADGSFQKELGDVEIETFTFNAGPAEIEALFADQIDIAYIGPSPALNGFVQSEGAALKIVAGSMSGGASFVVQPELAAAYRTAGDSAFIGKTFASPQQGNTQDVSLRTYFQSKGLLEQVTISPMANADQISLFQQQQLDGSWVPEPWVSRLVSEAGGEVLVDERDLWPNGSFATTVIIVSNDFLEQHPDVVKQWLTAHVTVTDWINAHPTEAQAIVNTEIEKLTGAALDETVLANAWERLDPTYVPDQTSIDIFRGQAETLGFIQAAGLDFNQLYDFSLLSEITGQEYQ
ncbi:MAG: ABC transporter substrate-binding protein [Candidatus Kerfeldbacteria bacterium]|nr:ABC transporter substrate-binding protein [Candidatus Kerfeldbacteria bacterium]